MPFSVLKMVSVLHRGENHGIIFPNPEYLCSGFGCLGSHSAIDVDDWALNVFQQVYLHRLSNAFAPDFFGREVANKFPTLR
jgi:hypothetical protein